MERNRRMRPWRRPKKLVAAVAMMLLTGSGVAAALAGGGNSASAAPDTGLHREKAFQIAESYTATVTPGSADARVTWKVGRVTFEASCEASSHPEDPIAPIHVGAGGGVTNNGPAPVRVFSGLEGSTNWLAPGESVDMGPLGPGEVVNEQFPEGQGDLSPIAVFDEGGVTATGLWGFSFWVDQATQTGHCLFTLQMKG